MLSNKLLIGASASGDYWISWIVDGGNASGIAVDSAGISYTSNWNGVFTKTDADGDVVYQKVLGSSTLTCPVIGESGNIYYAGYESVGVGRILKTDADGTLVWRKDLTATSIDVRCACFNGTNIAIGGTITVSSAVRAFAAIVTTAGAVLAGAAVTLVGTSAGTGYFYSIGADSSGNFYGTGELDNGTYQAAFLVKYNSSGALVWQRKISDAARSIRGQGIAVTSGGDSYVVVHSGSGHMELLKYNSSGTLQWQRRIVNGTHDKDPNMYYPTQVCVDTSDNCYFTIYANSTFSSAETVSPLFKYNSSGTLQWVNRIYRTAADAMGVDWHDGAVYLSFADKISTDWVSAIAKLPDDGSRLGTYGSWAYNASDFTDTAGSFVDATGDATGSTTALTSADDANTISNTSFTTGFQAI